MGRWEADLVRSDPSVLRSLPAQLRPPQRVRDGPLLGIALGAACARLELTTQLDLPAKPVLGPIVNEDEVRVVAVEARPLALPAILDRLVGDWAPREVAVVGFVVAHHKALLLLKDSPCSYSDQRDVTAEAAPSFTCTPRQYGLFYGRGKRVILAWAC